MLRRDHVQILPILALKGLWLWGVCVSLSLSRRSCCCCCWCWNFHSTVNASFIAPVLWLHVHHAYVLAKEEKGHFTGGLLWWSIIVRNPHGPTKLASDPPLYPVDMTIGYCLCLYLGISTWICGPFNQKGDRRKGWPVTKWRATLSWVEKLVRSWSRITVVPMVSWRRAFPPPFYLVAWTSPVFIFR